MAQASVDFFGHVIARRRGEATKVWINGNSLGCATGLYLATRLNIDGLVLRNPPSLVELISTRDAWWNLWRGGRSVAAGVPSELDAILNVAEITVPILYIESGADTIVPPYLQSLVRDAHPGPQRRVLLRDAEHNAIIDDDYKDELIAGLEWLLGI
jgi:pimeloyl-ACP methyl ester carboxylesterase